MDDEDSQNVSSDMIDQETISAYTWDKMKRSMRGAGFREGASAGWDLAFQTGFDVGYAQGYSDGLLLGVLKGIMSVSGQEVSSPGPGSDGSVTENILKKCSAGMCQRCADSGTTCEDFSEVISNQERLSHSVSNDLVQKYSVILKEHDIVFTK